MRKKYPLQIPCRRCGNICWQRVPRFSFVTSQIMDFFHLYPWRCALCGRLRLIALRADRRRFVREVTLPGGKG